MSAGSGEVTACQRTVARAVTASGRGLHSGKRVVMTIRPAAAGTGVRFRRLDRPPVDAEIPADWRLVCDTRLCTGLANEAGVRVRTIEHLLAALRACDIDNVVVELDAEELPIFDGSSAPLVALLDEAGISEQAAPRRVIRIDSPVEIGEDGKLLRLEPADRFEIDFTMIMPKSGPLRWRGALDPAALRAEIAPARTFGDLGRAWPLVLLGRLRLGPSLLRGASLSSALVLFGESVLNRGGLRMPDEFVRHRVLDLAGDLMLAGAPILGRAVAMRTGHRHNVAILEALFAADGAWSWDDA